ncbi:major capsid protein [Alcanivorax sp.]|nr:major capsid protein [Alcanivorax sp.]
MDYTPVVTAIEAVDVSLIGGAVLLVSVAILAFKMAKRMMS